LGKKHRQSKKAKKKRSKKKKKQKAKEAKKLMGIKPPSEALTEGLPKK